MHILQQSIKEHSSLECSGLAHPSHHHCHHNPHCTLAAPIHCGDSWTPCIYTVALVAFFSLSWYTTCMSTTHLGAALHFNLHAAAHIPKVATLSTCTKSCITSTSCHHNALL